MQKASEVSIKQAPSQQNKSQVSCWDRMWVSQKKSCTKISSAGCHSSPSSLSLISLNPKPGMKFPFLCQHYIQKTFVIYKLSGKGYSTLLIINIH